MEHLRKPITEMTGEELLSQIREIRRDRKIVKSARKEKAKKAVRVKAASAIDKLLAGMSDEQKAALLLELGGSDGD